ncbi:MAG: PHP domain-containing protein [Reichenbachiella sp.]
MTNSEIRQLLKTGAQLMELHGENPFKTRSYQSAADILKTMDRELSEMNVDEISAIEGIGKGMVANIGQCLERGSYDSFDKLMADTPEGVVEMLGISGFGPKKVGVLWQEGGAESLDGLLLMCQSGEVAKLKGFAIKTQDTLHAAVTFLISNRGKEKYANIEKAYCGLIEQLSALGTISNARETGQFRRRMEVVDLLEVLVASEDFEASRAEINALDILVEDELKSGPFSWVGLMNGVKAPLKIRFTTAISFEIELIKTTATPSHLNLSLADGSKLRDLLKLGIKDEKDFYTKLGAYIEPEMREGTTEVQWAQEGKLPVLLEMSDLKGVLHNHSTFSDGKHTLRQMAEHCKSLGYEYLGISDHSQTAVYANGLKEDRVQDQQDEIAKLNEELAPFRIFSGIESDILSDGSLDYTDEVLNSFDFIVASVHSGLNMDIDKATNRLLKAIENPHTTILGHMTGRLLLQREGYPVDHKAIIDACAVHGVVIEINASPYRLDIDWRWVAYAIEKGVMLSINPDAHEMRGYDDMKYGVLVGRKAGLTKKETLNTLSLEEISKFFSSRKK